LKLGKSKKMGETLKPMLDFIHSNGLKESEVQVFMDDVVNSDMDAWLASTKVLTTFFKSLKKADGSHKPETLAAYYRSVRVLVRLMPPNKRLFESCEIEASDFGGVSKLKRVYQDCMIACLQVCINLPSVLHRKLINYVSRHALPIISNPLLLSQFFLSALDSACKKTATTALVPLVNLMVSGGLGDIPELFPKLYSLLSADTLPEAPRSQLFPLLSAMLESSIIPQQWIAAFVKRLARVAVLSTDHSVSLWAVTAVYSLAQKNAQACRSLFHTDSNTLASDPFTMKLSLAEAAEQAKKSCLWEVNLLLCHGCPAVSRLSSLFKTNLFSLSAKRIASVDFAGLTDAALFQKERKTSKKRKLELAFLGGREEDARVARIFS